MAIQFQCPQCQSVIQVPDEASGKKGRCPQCEAKVRVPEVNIPAEPAPAAPQQAIPPVPQAPVPQSMPPQMQQPVAPPPQQPFPQNAAPAMPPNVAPGPFDINTAPQPQPTTPAAADQPAFPTGPVEEVPEVKNPIQRRKRRRHSGNLMIPLIFGALLLGGLVYIYRDVNPGLSGKISVSALNTDKLDPVIIPKREINASTETIDSVFERLVTDIESLETELMATEISPSDEGLRVELSPGSKTRFYQVSISSHPGLKHYYDQNINQIASVHEAILAELAEVFIDDWKAAIDNGEDIELETMIAHRDGLALTALSGPLGLQLQAVVGEQHFRCVYEKGDYLYFLLSKSVTEFTIEGRRLPDGSVPFTGRLTAIVKKQ